MPLTDHDLIIVGCGYSGEAIAARWTRFTGSTWGTTRSYDRAIDLEAAGIRSIVFDPLSDDPWPRIVGLKRPLAVVAFPPSSDDPHHQAILETISWLTSHGVTRVVYLSSTGVYGDHDGQDVDDETVPNPNTARGARRLAAERVFLAACQGDLVEGVVARLSGIYGPGRTVRDRLESGVYRLVDGGKLVSNRIFVDDVATAVETLLASGQSGEAYIVTDERPFELHELIGYATQELGIEAPAEIALEEVSERARDFYMGSKRCHASGLRSLGWKPTYPSFEHGLREAWRRERNPNQDTDQKDSPMNRIGTALQPGATRLLLLGSGELGREVVIEAMRFGVEVIACDRYDNAPAMQFAHRSHTINMQDPEEIRRVVELEKPHFIVPEIEAIATEELARLEQDGWTVIPTARATQLTMDREGIRRLAAEELGLTTSPYAFASTLQELEDGAAKVGFPCVIKPVMSSSGKGQSVAKTAEDVATSWSYAIEGSRGDSARVIVEGFVDFDTEITLLTVKTASEGTLFCPAVGHRQERGDYQESWQPAGLSAKALSAAQEMAEKVTTALGGRGLFGVEFFIKGDDVWFSEVSPRPHDTGMVTIATQDMNEFELHVRAILGLPIGDITLRSPGASAVILASEDGDDPHFTGVPSALFDPRIKVRLFGKPTTRPYRRMGVALAYSESVSEARRLASEAAAAVEVENGTGE